MFGEKMKWLYAFALLGITMFWAVFTVNITFKCVIYPTSIGVIEASGSSVLLGALITLNTNVNQYYFRKKTPDEPSK